MQLKPLGLQPLPPTTVQPVTPQLRAPPHPLTSRLSTIPMTLRWPSKHWRIITIQMEGLLELQGRGQRLEHREQRRRGIKGDTWVPMGNGFMDLNRRRRLRKGREIQSSGQREAEYGRIRRCSSGILVSVTFAQSDETSSLTSRVAILNSLVPIVCRRSIE